MSEKCWCWQVGRCLVLSQCPTAAHPHPNPLTDDVWQREASRLMAHPAPQEET